jgi:hypothetical protein
VPRARLITVNCLGLRNIELASRITLVPVGSVALPSPQGAPLLLSVNITNFLSGYRAGASADPGIQHINVPDRRHHHCQ